MIKFFLLSVLTFVLAVGAYLYFYLGVAKPVSVSIEARGPFHMLYKEHIGAYHEIGASIRAVEDWARTANVLCEKTFGEFFDDPQTVDQDRLRSHAGCLLSAPLTITHEGFLYEERPERRYAVGLFDGSPAIGPYKVYPKIKKFLGEQRQRTPQPVIETYLVNGNTVHTEYLFPLDPPPAAHKD